MVVIQILAGDAETIKQAIIDFITEIGLDMTKLSGFGSDGASVMIGKRNGVAAKLREEVFNSSM